MPANGHEVGVSRGRPVVVQIDGALGSHRAVDALAGVVAPALVALGLLVDEGLDTVGTVQGGALVHVLLALVVFD